MRVFNQLVRLSGKQCVVERNSIVIYEGKCIPNDATTFDFPHDSNVQPGDKITIKVSGETHIISSVKPQYCLDEDAVDFLEVHCSNSTQATPHSTIYNINTVYNSNIGENGTVNSNVSVHILEYAIIQNGHSVEEFQELLDVLQSAMKNNQCNKGFLSRFANVLQENSWLSQPLVQCFLAYFTGSKA